MSYNVKITEFVNGQVEVVTYKQGVKTLIDGEASLRADLQSINSELSALKFATFQKKDKQRASYYNYYTSKKWGDSRSYHLTLDSSALGIDKCVEMILQYRALYLMK